MDLEREIERYRLVVRVLKREGERERVKVSGERE